MKQRIKNILKPRRVINYAYNLVRIIYLKTRYSDNFFAPVIQSLDFGTTINIEGVLEIKGKIVTSPGVVLTVSENSELTLGNKVFINRNTIVVARENISIEDGTTIGPGVVFYDHDHVYDNDGKIRDSYATAPIVIGKRCWIGANAIILRGTVLGDHSIVGAGTIVKGEYPAYSKIYNNRELVVKDIQKDIRKIE